MTYELYKVHARTTITMQQRHIRTLTRNVVPAIGFAVSTLELHATTSGHEVPLPVYSSAMLQAVSPCSNQTTEHPIHRPCYNSGTENAQLIQVTRRCNSAHTNFASASGHQGIECLWYLFDYDVGLNALWFINAFRLEFFNHSMLFLHYNLTNVSQRY